MVDHVDYTVPTRQHELDHASYKIGKRSAWKDIDNEVGINRTDHTDHLSEVWMVGWLISSVGEWLSCWLVVGQVDWGEWCRRLFTNLAYPIILAIPRHDAIITSAVTISRRK